MFKNRMFPLYIQYDATKCLSVITDNEEWLWHLWLGHLNFTSLKMLASKKNGQRYASILIILVKSVRVVSLASTTELILPNDQVKST